MADDAIGAHQLDHADGILCRLVQVGDADLALARRPLAGQGADEIAIGVIRFLVAAPFRAAPELGRRQPRLAEA